MVCEWKELLVDQLWGCAKHLLLCPLFGYALMLTITHTVGAITGKEVYKTMPTKRKVSCWVQLSVFVLILSGIYRSFLS